MNQTDTHDPRAALASRVDAVARTNEKAFAMKAFAAISILFMAAWLLTS